MKLNASLFSKALLLAVSLSLLPTCSALQAADAPAATTAAPVDGAEVYYQWLMACIDKVHSQMPVLTESAERAAKLAVENDMPPTFTGNRTTHSETYGRSGGLKEINWAGQNEDDPKYTGVVLCFFGETSEQVAENIKEMIPLKKRGCVIVGVGRAALQKQAKDAGLDLDFFIDSGATASGWLLPVDGKGIIPTEPVANMVVQWAWTGEFVAACTRLGKMPTLWQSVAIPAAAERNKKLNGKRFHDSDPMAAATSAPAPESATLYKPKPIEAGKLGQAYLDELTKAFTAMHKEDMATIRKAADLAVDALKAGRKAYVFSHGHAIGHAHSTPYDPRYLLNLNVTPVQGDVKLLGKGDFVLCVGYVMLFRGEAWGSFMEKSREIGTVNVWSIAGFDPEENKLVAKDELFISQHWQKGDAQVKIDGYDVNVFPISGITAESLLWMVEAQIHTQQQATAKK